MRTTSTLMLALASVLAASPALAQKTERPTPTPPPTGSTTDTTPRALSFADLDVNADGKVSKDEAAADARLTSHFAQVDRDGDGQLSATEFAAGHASSESSPPR
ncbi:EF-hand domain-containing protein [Lysobacter sp. MMG2]|uniref:EF-hand domain-containing protein n=1 Tax=Lysobacter sp. MMG2 TaxID=2801338 RepID=UPI001C21337B|nr:EF-hand domain-containing protein [Lysobacter sp. MMG2]MBU8976583.1 EF-hand domain-containing protein [Lysobacter sp. MMG2]